MGHWVWNRTGIILGEVNGENGMAVMLVRYIVSNKQDAGYRGSFAAFIF